VVSFVLQQTADIRRNHIPQTQTQTQAKLVFAFAIDGGVGNDVVDAKPNLKPKETTVRASENTYTNTLNTRTHAHKHR